MDKKTLLGLTIILIPFIALFVAVGISEGWDIASYIYGAALTAFGCILGGLKLIFR